eukprot:6212433-Pleurochrysis_carterae.AAC.3
MLKALACLSKNPPHDPHCKAQLGACKSASRHVLCRHMNFCIIWNGFKGHVKLGLASGCCGQLTGTYQLSTAQLILPLVPGWQQLVTVSILGPHNTSQYRPQSKRLRRAVTIGQVLVFHIRGKSVRC